MNIGKCSGKLNFSISEMYDILQFPMSRFQIAALTVTMFLTGAGNLAAQSGCTDTDHPFTWTPPRYLSIRLHRESTPVTQE